MPVAFRILPSRALVLVTYSGVAGLQETIERTAECARHPDFDLRYRHLVDVSRITGYERDFPGFFAMQAKVMESYPPQGQDQIFVFLAPTRQGQEMAQMVRRSWDGLNWAIVRIVEDEGQALDLLGLREHSISELLAEVG
jgi:hypothetical protein